MHTPLHQLIHMFYLLSENVAICGLNICLSVSFVQFVSMIDDFAILRVSFDGSVDVCVGSILNHK